MPIIFVHGVSVRKTSDYDQRERDRDAAFQNLAMSRVAATPDAVKVLNPYWGNLGAAPAWKLASLPEEGVERFGPDDELVATLLSEGATELPEDPDVALLTIAQGSLRDAIDLLWVLAVDRSQDEEIAGLMALAAKTLDYVDAIPQPDWLDEVDNDAQFLVRLRREVDGWKPLDLPHAEAPETATEAFGGNELWMRVREGGSRVTGFAGVVGGGLVLSMARKPLQEKVSLFIGDVFVYLNARGDKKAKGPIIRKIEDAIESGIALRNAADPHLIIIAHSMGGNIVYDILTHFRPDLACDVLVTVGSQVGLFEELKLFHASQKGVPVDWREDCVDKPANIDHWLNVYDLNDVLSYAVAGIFADAQDFAYSTGKGLLSAHTTYFLRPSFHVRLGKRLKAILT